MKTTIKKTAMYITVINMIINTFLSLFKLTAGVTGNSSAMISDAVNDFADIFNAFVIIIGIKISNKKSDSSHPYGHERFESIASFVLSVILILTGLGIGYDGIIKIIQNKHSEFAQPGIFPLAASVISIAVKEGMYRFTKLNAVKLKSDVLMADAWHHRSDSLSSIGAFAGILGARLGFSVLDPAASIIICLLILKAAAGIFKCSVDKLVDKSCDEAFTEIIKKIILEQDGVDGIDEIRTRMFGSGIYIDIEISADGSLTLNEAHKIAENVHDVIENTFSDVRHCMVHVNPYNFSE